MPKHKSTEVNKKITEAGVFPRKDQDEIAFPHLCIFGSHRMQLLDLHHIQSLHQFHIQHQFQNPISNQGTQPLYQHLFLAKRIKIIRYVNMNLHKPAIGHKHTNKKLKWCQRNCGLTSNNKLYWTISLT